MLPNLIIAGVNKGGTTALFRHLASHPDILPSSVKETCYFLPIRYGGTVAPISEYKKYFEKYRNEKLVIECTPGYFYGGIKLVNKIKKTLPNARIVIVLRDPTSRFFSFFHFMKSMQKLTNSTSPSVYLDMCRSMTPEEFCDSHNNTYFGLQGGYYADYLNDWIQVFGDKLHIDFFENLVWDPEGFMSSVSHFAGVDPSPFNGLEFKRENVTKGHHNQFLHSLALHFYGTFSHKINSNKSLKTFLTSTYNRINGAPISKNNDEEEFLRQILSSQYQPSNKRLKDQLLSFEGSVGLLPNWVG
ncbi:sulfotransferase [Octadecabacter sp.]|nr:sulfotransferase [Octadecabacter sp.]